MFRASCHFLLALLAGLVMPDDYTTYFDTLYLSPIQTIPMGIKILYSCSFTYHLACYFFEAQKCKTDWKVCLLIVFIVGSCWIERFIAPSLLCFICIVMDTFQGNIRSKLDIMHIHHILTIALILGSWSYHLTTIGSLIMFINDVTDVPMFLVRKLRASENSHRSMVVNAHSCENSESVKQIVLALIVFVMWVLYRVMFMAIIFVRMCIYYHSNVHNTELNMSFGMNMSCIGLLVSMFVLLSFNGFWVYLLSCKLLKAVIKRVL
jgi:hypothetical protein